MTTLLIAKQYIRNFMNKYEGYLKPVIKIMFHIPKNMKNYLHF